MSHHEFQYDIALGLEPIGQGRRLAASSRTPKLVSAPFDLMLNAQVVFHCKKGRLLSSGLLSALHLTLLFIPRSRRPPRS